MKISFRGVLHDIFALGAGEAVGRACSIATAVLLGHSYGVVVLGVYALGQTVTQYLAPLIDFGLRHIGARLLARYPAAARDIVRRVQRRRVGMAGAVLPVVLLYSAAVKLPAEMKIFLFTFSAAGALYALSLDWAAWGQKKLYLVGWARAAPPVSILAMLVVAHPSRMSVLGWAAAGNALGFLLQAAMGWFWWKRQSPTPWTSADSPAAVVAAPNAVGEALAWRRSCIMGVAWLSNLAFNSVDILMLGLLSNSEQVGLYSASYRILNQVLASYYLLTQVLYPRFARHGGAERVRMLQARILGPLFGAGILIAAVLTVFRRPVLGLMFGDHFLAASPLLLLLSWSIPLDFMTSYLSNAYIAWGMEKKILLATGIAAASNIALNLAFVPRRGARAAALNTLISYAIFLASLWIAGRTAKELASGSRSDDFPLSAKAHAHSL